MKCHGISLYWMMAVRLRASVRLNLFGSIRLSMLVLACSVAVPVAGNSRVRPGDDPHLARLLDLGIQRSNTFRAVVERLEAAPILVLVHCDIQIPSDLAGRLHLLTSVAETRYVRVTLNCTRPLNAQIAALGHELQHALEVADNADIVDADSMESYYQDMGFRTYHDDRHSGFFETKEALSVELRVGQEMREKSD